MAQARTPEQAVVQPLSRQAKLILGSDSQPLKRCLEPFFDSVLDGFGAGRHDGSRLQALLQLWRFQLLPHDRTAQEVFSFADRFKASRDPLPDTSHVETLKSSSLSIL